jgi:hypothetical protein
MAGWQKTSTIITDVDVGSLTDEIHAGLDFGNYRLGTVTGQVLLQEGEGGSDRPVQPLAGWTVYIDQNNNGKRDPGEPNTVSTQFGLYFFANLAPGTHRIRQEVQRGFKQVDPESNGAEVVTVVTSGTLRNGVDFRSVAVPADPLVAYVTALYRDILLRGADQSGLNTWVARLRAGTTRLQVAQAFWESAEHRGIQVDGIYQMVLHRSSDPRGRASWVAAMRAGVSELDVIRSFLLSGEYAAAHPTNAAFVAGLYADVLGRVADPGGSATWQSRLRSGVSRTTVVNAFLTCDEAYLRLLDSYYASYLKRPADPAGELRWLAALRARQVSPAQVAEKFLASEEYFAHG